MSQLDKVENNSESDEDNSMNVSSTAAATGSSVVTESSEKKKKKKKKKNKKPTASADNDAQMSSSSSSNITPEKWLNSLTEDEILNPKLSEANHIAQLKSNFRSGQPFPHLCITDMLDSAYCKHLCEELRQLDYFTKSNDLFEFSQSSDLKSVELPLVKKFKSILYGNKFRKMLENITGIPLVGLEEAVDMSANVYGDGHTLLCHDDELHGRRIAYIFYLVPSSWSESDGGTLDLFNTDANGQPSTVARSLVPRWNSFTFFEVSPISFHQVSEILTDAIDSETGENKVRISISGWFHGENIERPPPYREPKLIMTPLINDGSSVLSFWLSKDYVTQRNIVKILNQFQEESSIELPNFIEKSKYDKLIEAFRMIEENQWENVGPANKRKFGHLKQLSSSSSSSSASVPSSFASSSDAISYISSLQSFFSSVVFGNFLHSITGMDYLSVNGTVRRFGSGCYTLAHNEDEERFEEAVDVSLCAILSDTPSSGASSSKPPAKKGARGISSRGSAQSDSTALNWDSDNWGGSTHYIEEGVEEELMSLQPCSNTLSIVYRSGVPAGSEREMCRSSGTGGVMKFIKYINHRAKLKRMDFDFTFRVENTGESEEEDEDEDMESSGSKTSSTTASKAKKGKM